MRGAKKIEDSDKIKAGIKLSQEDIDFFLREGSGKSINRGIVCMANILRSFEANGYVQLLNKLTGEEWRFVAMILKNDPIKLEERVNPQILARLVLTSSINDVLSEVFHVDQTELFTKISMFNAMQSLALINRCRDFWREHPDWLSGESKHEKVMINWCNKMAKKPEE